MNVQLEPIRYDPRGSFIEGRGVSASDIDAMAPRLAAAREEVLHDLELWTAGGPIPSEKEPLDAGFIDLPDRLLADYRANHESSELGMILAAADRLREAVDRVVVLGIGGSYMGARAMMEACCHPYHNELHRGDRGSRPRMYFEGNNVDNDATHGLLDLLRSSGKTAADRWAIVVISKSGGTLETAASFRIFLRELKASLGSDGPRLGDLVVPVTGRDGKLFDLATALECRDIFRVPDGVGGRFSVLSAVGLLPAAILGLDVVRLLEGATIVNGIFRTAPLGENPVLDYVAVSHWMESQRNATTRLLSVWSRGLEAVGLWYDQLLAESLGKNEQGALPLTIVNTRDLHSRGQQHQQGSRDKIITNVIVDSYRQDPLSVGHQDTDQDQLNSLSEKTLPDIMYAALEGTNQAYREDGRPTTNLHLPMQNESSLGQLFQMLMLATVVEGRLIGTNPYGQPGVEDYKRNMNAILRERE